MIKNWIVKTKLIRNSGTKFKYKKVTLTGGKTRFERIKGSGRVVKNGFSNHVNYLKDASRAAHVSYTHHRAPESVLNVVCRLLLEKKYLTYSWLNRILL